MDFIFKRNSISPEVFFIFSILTFGIFSTFLTFPLTNGDEGYHLSRSYTIFSRNMPQSMETETLRAIETKNIEPDQTNNDFSLNYFFSHTLTDVEKDTFTLNFQQENNITAKIDLGHLPAALGILIARYIYPSYGVMMVFARIANLIFFSICLFFIIKHSNAGKWSLVMLFSVPFIQKIASPSYDVFAYVAIAAFATNILRLAKLDKFTDLSIQKCLYTIFTIFLILLSKNNYIFILPALLLLPMVTSPIKQLYIAQKRFQQNLFWIIMTILVIAVIILLDSKLGLVNFSKQFFHSYFNTVTMGRRANSLFDVVSTILPNFLNILWLLCLFFVMLTEEGYNWNKPFVMGNIAIFFLNWVGIYAGFYVILGKLTFPFDELSGRYLHPFIICFLPFTQLINYKYKLTVPNKTIKLVTIIGTMTILISYLIICYYRGFIIHTTPTWKH